MAKYKVKMRYSFIVEIEDVDSEADASAEAVRLACKGLRETAEPQNLRFAVDGVFKEDGTEGRAEYL